MAVQTIRGECCECVNCCGVVYHVEDGRLIKVEGDPLSPVNRGELCPKGEVMVDMLYSEERLKTPLKKVGDEHVPISWDQAMDEISAKLGEIRDEYGAQALVCYAGSVAVERLECAAFLQRFRMAYGTPNYFSVETGCYVSRVVSRAITFGYNLEADWTDPRSMILWAHDPYGSKFSFANKIEQELVPKKMKLIVIDPRRHEMAKLGKWVCIRPGTDCALALGMMHVAIKEALYDKRFVEDYVFGFDELAEHVKQYSPEQVAKITEVPADDIVEITHTFFENQPGCIVQGTGSLDRQANTMQNSRALAILQAFTGSINVPGGWIAFPPYGLPDLRLPDFKGKAIGVEKYPLFFARGIYGDFAPYGPEGQIIKAMITDEPYPIRAFISTAGNPAVQVPDPLQFKKALDRMELKVCVELFMTETAKEADYVLPSTTWMEESGIGSLPVGWTHGGLNMCSYRHQIVEPVGDCWPNWKIWSELGRRLGHGEYFPWNSNEEVTAMMLSETGIPLETLKNTPGQIRLPVEYGHHRYEGFPTQSGKVEFYSHAFEAVGQSPVPVHREPTQSPVSDPELAEKYPLILVSGVRVREYIHSALRHMEKLKAMRPEPEVDIHPDAAKKYGVADGKMVEVATKSGAVKMKARVTEDIHPNTVGVPHGWANANANALIDDDDREPSAGYPQDKALLCSVRPV